MNFDELPSLFKLTRSLSRHSTGRHKIGCIILDHGKPVSGGFNKPKTHPKWNYPNKLSIHAEVSAILSSGKNYMKNSVAIVYRERANGLPAMARPCKYCMRMLREFGVKKVIYSTNSYPYFTTEYISV